MHREEGLDWDDLIELGFIPLERPGMEGNEFWFEWGSTIRVCARNNGWTDIYVFEEGKPAAATRGVERAFIGIDGALPSTVYRRIIESVISADKHE